MKTNSNALVRANTKLVKFEEKTEDEKQLDNSAKLARKKKQKILKASLKNSINKKVVDTT